MNKTKSSTRIQIVCFAFILIFFFHSCKKDGDQISTIPKSELIAVQQWYEDNLDNLEANPFASMVPLWSAIRGKEEGNQLIYEIPLLNPQKIFLAKKSIKDNEGDLALQKNVIKLLVFKDKAKPTMDYAAFMAILNEGTTADLSKMHYKETEKLNGKIFYYDLSGTFVMGWGYKDGKVVKKANIGSQDWVMNNFSISEFQLFTRGDRILNMPPPGDCFTEQISVFGVACVDAGASSGPACNFYLIRTDTYMYCDDSGTGTYVPPPGGGGGNGNNGNSTITPGSLENGEVLADGKPKITNITKYTDCFTADGKTAQSYTLTMYADQPVSGSAAAMGVQSLTYLPIMMTGTKVLVGADAVDVGHTFVGFEKHNTDGSTTRQVLGFYPDPSGSSFNSKGAIKDDSGHAYDVSYTVTVNVSQFNQALNYLKTDYNTVNYDLYNYNCTNAAITWFGSSGETFPSMNHNLFKNTPGNVGQQIRNTSNANVTAGNAPQGKGPC